MGNGGKAGGNAGSFNPKLGAVGFVRVGNFGAIGAPDAVWVPKLYFGGLKFKDPKEGNVNLGSVGMGRGGRDGGNDGNFNPKFGSVGLVRVGNFGGVGTPDALWVPRLYFGGLKFRDPKDAAFCFGNEGIGSAGKDGGNFGSEIARIGVLTRISKICFKPEEVCRLPMTPVTCVAIYSPRIM